MQCLRLGLLAVVLVAGLAYLLSPAFHSELGLAFGIPARGGIGGPRDYILAFGAWATVIPVFPIVLQAVVAQPAFCYTSDNVSMNVEVMV